MTFFVTGLVLYTWGDSEEAVAGAADAELGGHAAGFSEGNATSTAVAVE
jgi:hypothetical protein